MIARRPPYLPPYSYFLCVDWFIAQIFIHQEKWWAKINQYYFLWISLVRSLIVERGEWHYYFGLWMGLNRGRWKYKWLYMSFPRRLIKELLVSLPAIVVSWSLFHITKDGKIGILPKMEILGKHVCFGVKQPWAQPLTICVNLDLSLNHYLFIRIVYQVLCQIILLDS